MAFWAWMAVGVTGYAGLVVVMAKAIALGLHERD